MTVEIDEFVEAKKFHGDKLVAESQDFLNKIVKKDRVKQQKAVREYLEKFDDSKSGVDDRRSNYKSLVNNFYDLVTDFYEYGWGQSFHFSRFFKGEGFDQSIARHEHYLSMKLGLKKGIKTLDIGCGVGGPMREIARFSGAEIVGINNNAYQIERLKLYNQKAGLENVASAVKGDFMNLPFENESFDAAYAIEATVHAPSLEGVLKEVYRVLKPGGVFASYEWCCTNEYDKNDPDQKRVIFGIETGNGISYMPTIDEALQAIKNAGFEIIEYEDMAPFDPRYEEPWYLPLQGSLTLKGFRMSRVGRFATDQMVWALERLGLAPPGSRNVSKLLNDAADNLVEGGVRKLFTPMFFYLIRKPAN